MQHGAVVLAVYQLVLAVMFLLDLVVAVKCQILLLLDMSTHTYRTD